MRFTTALTAATLATSHLTTSVSIPAQDSQLSVREADALPESQILEKRRGGGGSGGRGGSSSSSSGSSSSGSSSSSSSSSSSGGRGGSSSSSSASTGVRGGGTTSASAGYRGPGGSSVYAGGAAAPYRAGSTLPRSGASPLLLGAGVGLVGGALLFGGAPYYYYGPYGYRYPYYNNQTRGNESLPISCVCAQYNPCGCDDIDQKDVVDDQLSDGTANITTVNGTRTVVINGTLDNGTAGNAGVSLNGQGSAVVWPVAVMVGAMIWGL